MGVWVLCGVPCVGFVWWVRVVGVCVGFVLRRLCVRVESECGVCAESVCGMCVLCFGVVVCCVVSLCVVLVLVFGAQCCGVCGVCAWCVLCVRCGVWCLWCLCVWRGLARGKTSRVQVPNASVCTFKTLPCVGSKRLRVYRQNARMLNTCARVAGAHGGVLNLYTETF